jgi:hypothetical protein
MKVLQVEFNDLSPQPASLAAFVRTVGAMVRDSSRTGGETPMPGCPPSVTASRIRGTADGSEPPMGDVFVPIHTVRSGRHGRDGALWFRTGRHEVHEEPVDLASVAPTVLALLGVLKPAQMTGEVLPVGDVTTRA